MELAKSASSGIIPPTPLKKGAKSLDGKPEPRKSPKGRGVNGAKMDLNERGKVFLVIFESGRGGWHSLSRLASFFLYYSFVRSLSCHRELKRYYSKKSPTQLSNRLEKS